MELNITILSIKWREILYYHWSVDRASELLTNLAAAEDILLGLGVDSKLSLISSHICLRVVVDSGSWSPQRPRPWCYSPRHIVDIRSSNSYSQLLSSWWWQIVVTMVVVFFSYRDKRLLQIL